MSNLKMLLHYPYLVYQKWHPSARDVDLGMYE